MAIVASAGGSSIPPHPEGQFAGNCVDVIDRGMVETRWQDKIKKAHKVTIRFYCGQQAENGTPLWVDKWFRLSLHEKSALRPFLESWRQKKFTDAELAGFDLEVLIGKAAYLQISQSTKGGTTYANIDTIMRLPPGVPAAPLLKEYVRACDRPDRDGENGHSPFDDDDLESSMPL